MHLHLTLDHSNGGEIKLSRGLLSHQQHKALSSERKGGYGYSRKKA